MFAISQLTQRLKSSCSSALQSGRWSPQAVGSSNLCVKDAAKEGLLVCGLRPWQCVLDLQFRLRSNRSRRGLYDGKDIRSGNKRSHSMRATRRKFKPNVQMASLYSEILDEKIRFHVTTSALRSIDRVGGLDNYLLNSKHVTEGEGMKAKKRILRKMKLIEKGYAQHPLQHIFDNLPLKQP